MAEWRWNPSGERCRNQKAWNQLEIYCRDLALKKRRLYVVAGPAGQGGRGTAGFRNATGPAGKVTVPSLCWKVIAVPERGGADDRGKVTKDTRVIAVVSPNDDDVGLRWPQYARRWRRGRSGRG